MAEWQFALTIKELSMAAVLHCARDRKFEVPEGEFRTTLEFSSGMALLTITHPVPPPPPPKVKKPFRWFWQRVAA